MKKKKIDITLLYVEDEPIIGETMMNFFNYRVKNALYAKDGLEALEMLKKEDIDVVVTDMVMPKLDGLGLIKEIKSSPKLIRVAVLSAFNNSDKLTECIELGVERFFKKPLELKKLEFYLEQVGESISSKRELEKTTKLLEQYKKAVDESAIVSITDKYGVIEYANDEFCRITGYSSDELIGSTHRVVKSPATKEEKLEELWSTITSKKIWKGVFENKAKDGSSYYVKATVVPLLNNQGEIENFIDIATDITELIYKERQLEKLKLRQFGETIDRLKEQKIGDLIKTIPVASFCINEDDIVVEYNSEFMELIDRVEDDESYELLKAKKLNILKLVELKDSSLHDDVFGWKDCILISDEVDGIPSFVFRSGSVQKDVKISLKYMEDKKVYIGIICQ
ncbi:MAG: response regulator [Campylobacterales bacterium]